MRRTVLFFFLIFSFKGFSQSDTTSKYLQEVVVSSSRISEKLLYSPVSIVKLDKGFFQRSAQSSFLMPWRMYKEFN